MAISKETQEILGRLRDLRATDMSVREVTKALALQIEAEKDRLVDAHASEVAEVQGRVRMAREILKELTVVPPHIQQRRSE